MQITPLAAAVIGLVLALWTGAAGYFIWRASGQIARAKGQKTRLLRMQALLDSAPALPMMVRADGRIEAPERLARWLGFDAMPTFIGEIANHHGLTIEQADELAEKISDTSKSAAPFALSFSLEGTTRGLEFHGALADPLVSAGGAVIIWVFDTSQSREEITRLREAARRAEADFGALIGLIEAAPMPMWFRGRDMQLQLVNQAYVAAVGASNAASVVEEQIELLEPDDAGLPAQIAQKSLESGAKTERTLTATIHGARRSLRVSDLPLGHEGVAGYAIDIEEEQQRARELRAFREVQRALLDQLSVGVVQFDGEEQLVFANSPARRIFELGQEALDERLTFGQFLVDARERGRTPEVRDFPQWRSEHLDWLGQNEMKEEAWPLPGGTHLRIVAHPMPDGGLVLIAEDQTENLALSAVRDTLLRTRTATLDSLFEALAIFAPDGSMQLWNRSFPGTWALDPDFLDGHPTAQQLLETIASNLKNPAQAEQIGAVVRAATLDRQQKRGQVELRDGRTLRFAGIPLPDGNGLLTVLDITDAQMAEQALRERAKALEEADAVKTRFLANMSYEFRTPLTTISGFAEMLKEGAAGDLGPVAGEYIDAILASVERLTGQVENVLDLSQSEAGLLPIAKEPIDLLEFLTAIVRDRETAIIAADLGLDLKGKKGRVAQIDPRKLGRAVGNLLDNSIAGTKAGGKIVIELARKVDDQGFSNAITLTDNGEGMSDAELARALGDAAGGNGSEGGPRNGLGIPLARQLIEAHGGRLELSSIKGRSTTARILLP